LKSKTDIAYQFARKIDDDNDNNLETTLKDSDFYLVKAIKYAC
jgi:hypothetical protein